ncbi:MAG: hypothetical protein WA750_20150 [Pseudolabrys sp.]
MTVGDRLTSHVWVTFLSFVMPGHSHPKGPRALHAYVPGVHVFDKKQGVDGRDFRHEDGASRLSPGHDEF